MLLTLPKLVSLSSAAFDRIKSETEEDLVAGMGIRTFCPTRWTVCGE